MTPEERKLLLELAKMVSRKLMQSWGPHPTRPLNEAIAAVERQSVIEAAVSGYTEAITK